MKGWLIAGIVYWLVGISWAQNPPKHFIYFIDKADTPFTVNEPLRFLSPAALDRRQRFQIPVRSRDLPVTPAYVTQLKASGALVWYTSRWFNGALVQCDSATYRRLQQLPCVKSAQTVSRLTPRNPRRRGQQQESRAEANALLPADPPTYGAAYEQAKLIGVPAMHAAGYQGAGVRIAVFDAGFAGINRIPAFQHLFRNNGLTATFDFVDKNTGVMEKDGHGTEVLSTMAANQPGVFVGTAPAASYALFITEDARREQHLEEINWLLAAEFADSAGVDIIQSSLGYNLFDEPAVNYSYQDMNGKNALVTRAADLAAAAGMLVVVSAGNEGNDPWQYVTAPADADSVLSVGATDSLGRRAAFSSVGPTADGRIKPELAGQGLLAAVINPAGNVIRANGTSFSAPIICGLAAGFWQANRHLTNLQVIAYLQQSATQALKPDNRLGYGIPHYQRAQLLVNESLPGAGAGFTLFPNPVAGDSFSVSVPVAADGTTEVRLFNALGQEIDQFTYSFSQIKTGRAFLKIEVKGLAPGIYYCTLTGLNRSETIRFLKL